MAVSIGTASSDERIINNDTIARRLKEHRSEISKCINPNELIDHMCEAGLAEMELLDNYNESRANKVEALLNAVESSRDPDAFITFVECVNKEKEHLGHSYVVKLLLGEEFATSMHNDITTSAIYRNKCKQNIKTLKHNMNIEDLLPMLNAKGIFTSDELERLTNPMMMTRQGKVSSVLSLLETKGPTAHLLFVECLEQESENPSHKELLQLFDINTKDHGLKRKANDQIIHTSKIPRLTIIRQTKADQTITSQIYLEAVEKIHTLQYSGRCQAAIIEVEAYKSTGQVELYVALMCRNWYAYVNCHRSPQEVDSMVKDAMESLKAFDSDNRAILESRCKWMLSKYYWYMNDKKKASKYIDESLEIQAAYQVAPGEDTLLTHYGKACTLLDTLAEQWSSDVANRARKFIENANDFAMHGNYGLYLSHHCIRLAQISLRSSPQHPGVCNDRSDLNEAASTLRMVDEYNLSPRTKCLFYITYSDYYRNLSNHKEALGYVEKARSIAECNGFGTELESIEKRFSVLKVED